MAPKGWGSVWFWWLPGSRFPRPRRADSLCVSAGRFEVKDICLQNGPGMLWLAVMLTPAWRHWFRFWIKEMPWKLCSQDKTHQGTLRNCLSVPRVPSWGIADEVGCVTIINNISVFFLRVACCCACASKLNITQPWAQECDGLPC